MAALQPGASVKLQRRRAGRHARCADRRRVPSRPCSSEEIRRRARARSLADVSLDELLSLQPSKLAKKIDGAQVIVVRSQEIDHAGETGFTFQARQVMDTVIDNLARAIRKLAAAGVEHCRRDRRSWPSVLPFGSRRVHADRLRRGATRSISIAAAGSDAAERPRLVASGSTAAALGYDSDLDFVFPLGSGVFKAGGDLAFHHGGPSLQELVIPVLTVRMKAPRTRTVDRWPRDGDGHARRRHEPHLQRDDST